MLLFWCYDDKHTVGCLLATKASDGKFKYYKPILFTDEKIEDKMDNLQKELRVKKG